MSQDYPYEISRLTLADSNSLLALQEVVLADLKTSGNESFMLRKSEEYINNRLSGKTGMTVGARCCATGELVGAYSLLAPQSDNEVDLVDISFPVRAREIGIIESCMVHPAHRHHKLAAQMIPCLEKEALKDHRCQLFAECALDNPASFKSIMNNNFSIVSIGYDDNPATASLLFYLYKDLQHPDYLKTVANASARIEKVRYTDWRKLLFLIVRGFEASVFDKNTASFTLVQSKRFPTHKLKHLADLKHLTEDKVFNSLTASLQDKNFSR